jgi:hypothetical protein
VEEISIPNVAMQEKHMENFLEAVRNKNHAIISSSPEDAFRSSATVQLAMISHYTGSLVKWDADKNEIVDNKPASLLMKREYRGKYKHPFKA